MSNIKIIKFKKNKQILQNNENTSIKKFSPLNDDPSINHGFMKMVIKMAAILF